MKKFKDVLLLIVLVLLVYFAFFKKPEIIEREVTITPKTEVKKDTKPIIIEKTKVEVKYLKGDTEYVKGETKYIKGDTVYMEVDTKKYTYKDSLANGVLESIILADNIYDRKIKLTTFEKHIKETVVKSMLFLEADFDITLNGFVKSTSVSIDYTHKNKWRVGAGPGIDFISGQPYVKAKFAIPLN
jgi:hypothetical protein